jgi:hypothetical protein
MTLDLSKLEALAKAATPGPWDVDDVQTDGEYGSGEDTYRGFKSYVVGCGPVDNWRSIIDTSNSDVAMVEVDGDCDGTTAWDEVGRCNTQFIAAAREAVPALIARVRELEAALKPFADEGETWPELNTTRLGMFMIGSNSPLLCDTELTVGSFRNASRLLKVDKT